MTIHIAIPEPTSSDHAYNAWSLPQYIAAIQSAGGLATVIPLHERPDRVARLLSGVQGVLLPGSGCDVDPQTYGEDRIAQCGEPDPARAAVDELLMQDAFNLNKPILAICYGVQTLNVWRNGSLIQDLACAGKNTVNHTAGRGVIEAHPVKVAPGTRLASLIPQGLETIPVNSSHHQALRTLGDNLIPTAVSPADGVVEAIELDSPDHFVTGIQWHPERTYTVSPVSRAIFAAFLAAAGAWQPRRVEESVGRP